MSKRLDRIADDWSEETMIDRQHGKLAFECDTCADTLETDTGDFTEARNSFQAERWFSKRNDADTDWLHFCPACTPGAKSNKGGFRAR